MALERDRPETLVHPDVDRSDFQDSNIRSLLLGPPCNVLDLMDLVREAKISPKVRPDLRRRRRNKATGPDGALKDGASEDDARESTSQEDDDNDDDDDETSGDEDPAEEDIVALDNEQIPDPSTTGPEAFIVD